MDFPPTSHPITSPLILQTPLNSQPHQCHSSSLHSMAITLKNPNLNSRRCRRLVVISASSILFLLISGVSIAFLVRSKTHPSSINRTPTQAISRTCSHTPYPDLCIESLVNFPGALTAGERDLVHITLNMTLQRLNRALYDASAISGVSMDVLARSAYDDCMELLDDSTSQLSESLASVSLQSGSINGVQDVLTWLSAALTNQDTCSEGLDGVEDSYVRKQMDGYLQDLSDLVSNSLAIFAVTSKNQDFSGIPIQNKRRKLLNFPEWVKPSDRRLLQAPATSIQADMIVSKGGENGSYKKIADAVKKVPKLSNKRTVIYVKAGTYEENIKIARKQTNVMFIGDGKGKTIVTGRRSVLGNYTTFHSATFGMYITYLPPTFLFLTLIVLIITTTI